MNVELRKKDRDFIPRVKENIKLGHACGDEKANRFDRLFSFFLLLKAQNGAKIKWTLDQHHFGGSTWITLNETWKENSFT